MRAGRTTGRSCWSRRTRSTARTSPRARSTRFAVRPRSPYAASKAAAELLARSYGVTYGLPVWIVRGTNAFGPRQNPGEAIPVFTTAALEGRPLPVYDDGRQSREWLYVTDWAAACITALITANPAMSSTSATASNWRTRTSPVRSAAWWVRTSRW